MELIDIYDAQNNFKIGVKSRNEIHEKRLWHREVEAFVMNPQNEILLQKRSLNKKMSPNKWGLCGGHVSCGESERCAVARETNEEIGTDFKEENFVLIGVYKNVTKINQSFRYIYIVKTSKNIEEFKIQKSELSDIRYINIEEFKEIIACKNNNYTFASKKYSKCVAESLMENINININNRDIQLDLNPNI
ncbi:MAG: NUDIX domain-containing protein [Clostridia bacterium]